MTSRDDVVGRLDLASDHPWGPTRTGLVAEAVALADALRDDQLAIDARLALAEARHRGNEEWKALTPFVWLLARLDEHPELFDADRLARLGRTYERVVPVAADNPAVSIAQLGELEAGLKRFSRLLGGSTHATHGGLLHAAIMLGLEEDAAGELAAWRSTARDAGREDHDPLPVIEWASIHEDWETAVAAAEPVLGEREDDDRLYAVQSEALLPLLASGRSHEAWNVHARSYRMLRDRPNVMGYLGKHLEYLALSGRGARSLRLMRAYAGRIDEAQSARVLMDLLAGAVLALRESERDGRGDEPLDADIPSTTAWFPGPEIDPDMPLHAVRVLIEGWVRSIAARYDARNGNTAVSARLDVGLARAPFISAEEVVGRHARAVSRRVEEPEASTEEVQKVRSAGTPVSAPAPTDASAGAGTSAGAAAPAGADATAGAPAPSASAPAAAGETAVEAAPLPTGPYSPVDLRTPPAVGDADDLLRRLEAELLRPGQTLEHAFLIGQAMRRGLVPDPDQVAPELVRAACSLRCAIADRGWDYERAADELARLRTRLDGVAHPLRLIELDLQALQVDSSARDLHDRSTDRTRADELARAEELAERLTPLAERLLDEPADHRAELVDAYRSATALVRFLSGRGDHRGGAEFLELARLIAPHVSDLLDPRDGTLDDQLILLEAETLMARDDVRGARALADSVLRRYDPCPVVLAEAARRILVRASMTLGETETAVSRSRELLDIHLSVGLDSLAGPFFGTLAASLSASGRPLEAAEVLETALSADAPRVLAEELRRTLVSVLERLGEEEGVRDNCLIVAESALKRGETERGAEYLLRAASACERLEESTRASRLFERAAELVDTGDDAGRVRCAKYLRRAARAAVAEPAVLAAPVRPDEARALMSRARGLVETVPDSPEYSKDLELGDWHDDMAWILWRTGERVEALEHCEKAFLRYEETGDRGTASHPLTLMALIHAEMGETGAAREDIARVRRLLAHPRWEGHPALTRVANLEEALGRA